MRECPQVEALHIGRMDSVAFGLSNSCPSDDDIVELPNLRMLSLNQISVLDVRKILRRISIPPTAHLKVGSCLNDTHNFHDIFPPWPHKLRNIEQMRSLS